MADHTPERWDLGPYVNGRYRIITPTDVPFEAWVVADVATLANARLIAAAPELLQLAEAYAKWEADLITNDESWDNHSCPRLTQAQVDELVRIQGLRNAALAKARGTTDD